MIIFDLSSLADDSHRRNLITHPDETKYIFTDSIPHENGCILKGEYRYPDGSKWQPDMRAYYEACDGDNYILPAVWVYNGLSVEEDIQIWSSTCESQREKTINWIGDKIHFTSAVDVLKLRPIGDDRPQEELFEEWISENWQCDFCRGNCGCLLRQNNPNKHLKKIDMVFSSHGPTIAMFRKRGVFVFDCNQGE